MPKEAFPPAITIEERSLDGSRRVLRVETSASLQWLSDTDLCPPPIGEIVRAPLSPQQQFEITVGQALLGPNLHPTGIAALLACGGRVSTTDGHHDGVDLQSFLARTEPQPGAMSALFIPLDVPNRHWGLAQVRQTPADHPLVAAIAVVDATAERVDLARLALTGVWRQHARLATASQGLLATPLSAEAIERTAGDVMREVEPVEDFLGSEAYRRAMAGEVTRRALRKCLQGIEGDRS